MNCLTERRAIKISKSQISQIHRNLLLAIVSLLSYGVLVSHPIEHFYHRPDSGGFVDLHFTQYLGVTFSGLLLGQALSLWAVRVFPKAISELLPKASAAKRTTYLRGAAWTFVLLSMLPSLLWTVSVLNVFIDTHRGLFVEVNLLIFLMGSVNSIAWRVLLPHHSWFGFLFTPMFQLMALSNVLAPYSWHP